MKPKNCEELIAMEDIDGLFNVNVESTESYESGEDRGMVNVSYGGLGSGGFEYVMIRLNVSDDTAITIPDSSVIFYGSSEFEFICSKIREQFSALGEPIRSSPKSIGLR